jgi:hypothetical protein
MAAIALLVFSLFVGIEIERVAIAAEPAEKVQFVAELEGVEELKLLGAKPSWTTDDETQFAAEVAAAREAWKTEAAKFQEKLSPEKVRSLSRWAKPQMEKYNAVPPLDKAKISAAGLTADKKSIVFESTIDTLPTHSPLVTRWLKVYFIYDLSTKSIRHTTITIRGQVLE